MNKYDRGWERTAGPITIEVWTDKDDNLLIINVSTGIQFELNYSRIPKDEFYGKLVRSAMDGIRSGIMKLFGG